MAAPVEANFHLYIHQLASGQDKNQTVAANAPDPNYSGVIAINDWTVREGSDPGSKLVARAQGMHAHCGTKTANWYTSFDVAFQDDSRYKGSTLQVRGAWDPSSPINWAVVGGTGEFKLAKGIVSGATIRSDGNGRVMEVSIRIFYTKI